MKKILIMVIAIFLLSGCAITKVDLNDYETLIPSILTKENLKPAREIAIGYKYYLPRGTKVTNIEGFNAQINAGQNKIYLYVDVVSYFYKKQENYEINKQAYYSKVIDIDGKKGFIEIKEDQGLYFIKILYNYARIESLVKFEDMNQTFTKMLYIVSNIQYNDQIIASMINKDEAKFKEETFTLYEPKNREGNFVDYINEYDKFGQNLEELLEEEKARLNLDEETVTVE